MTKQSKEQRLAEKFKRREILRMTIAQKGDDLFFILDGVKVAVRGKPRHTASQNLGSAGAGAECDRHQ